MGETDGPFTPAGLGVRTPVADTMGELKELVEVRLLAVELEDAGDSTHGATPFGGAAIP